MFDRFANDAKQVMQMTRVHAIRLRHNYIDVEHILLAILQAPDTIAATMLARCGVDRAEFARSVERVFPAGSDAVTDQQLPLTSAAKQALEAAVYETRLLDNQTITSGHLLLGLASSQSPVGALLSEAGASPDRLRDELRRTTWRVPAHAESMPAASGSRDRVRALLISNSTMHGGGYLEHCAAEIADFLGAKKRVLFVPFALHDHDAYTAKARQAFTKFGHELVSLHEHEWPSEGGDSDAVFIGGGNTFRLLHALYRDGLLAKIEARALTGMPYIGSSAGTNVATLSIRTTNDMPIVQPPSFTALRLVPFQINPHYLDPEPGSRHMGETREERIRQFHEEHQTPVLGLREGCMLRVEGRRLELRGTTRARLFRHDAAAEEFSPPCDMSFLMQFGKPLPPTEGNLP